MCAPMCCLPLHVSLSVLCVPKTHIYLKLHLGERALPRVAVHALLSFLSRHSQQLSKQMSRELLYLKPKPAETYIINVGLCTQVFI